MHGLQACLFKYITAAVVCIYALHGEAAAKGGGGGGGGGMEAVH